MTREDMLCNLIKVETKLLKERLKPINMSFANSAELDWNVAIVQKCSEGIEQCPWDWWSSDHDESFELEQLSHISLEVFRLIVAKISSSYDEAKAKDLFSAYLEEIDICSSSVEPVEEFKAIIHAILSEDIEKAIKHLLHVYAFLDLEFEDVYAKYLAFAALHRFEKNIGCAEKMRQYRKVFGLSSNIRSLSKKISALMSTENNPDKLLFKIMRFIEAYVSPAPLQQVHAG